MATLDVGDARLHYEVRGDGPPVALVGAPMDARPFAALADLLASDYTVLTADPRGVCRSPATIPDSTPQLRANDLSQLLKHIGAASATVFGSSGGAVTALAFAQAFPEQAGLVIAHEPPLVELLDDREQLRVRAEDMIDTYLAGDVAGAWGMFFAIANMPVPPGAAFERDPQQSADEHHFFAHEYRGTVSWQPDLAALRRSRIVVGVGRASAGQLCDRTSGALAAALGVQPTAFPAATPASPRIHGHSPTASAPSCREKVTPQTGCFSPRSLRVQSGDGRHIGVAATRLRTGSAGKRPPPAGRRAGSEPVTGRAGRTDQRRVRPGRHRGGGQWSASAGRRSAGFPSGGRRRPAACRGSGAGRLRAHSDSAAGDSAGVRAVARAGHRRK
jgi:pimeloyl-ACP methyl ester carboxylesterase